MRPKRADAVRPYIPFFFMGHPMQITVKLFATFRIGRFAATTREVAKGTTIADVIRELRIPETEIGMIILNNRHSDPECLLKEGDTLSIFPLVGGG